MRASVKDAFRMRSSAAVIGHPDEVPDLTNARQSMAVVAAGAPALRMSIKPGAGGLARSATMRRGSMMVPSGGGEQAAVAMAPLRTGLERLMMRLEGAIRRFQAVAMAPGARVLSCEKNMASGMYEVRTVPGKAAFSSPHDFEAVEYMMKELTPHGTEDPCTVSCVAWARGPAAQAQHDLFCLPLLTADPGSNVQVSDALVRPASRSPADTVYLASDVTEIDGIQRVGVSFDPQTLFELCANLAEKWSAADGTTGMSFTLPCSPSTGRRFQPWKDVRWLPHASDLGAVGAVSGLARRLFGGPR